MNFSFSFLLTALAAGAAKIPVTLLLSAAPMLAGCVIGLFIALARFFRVPVLAVLFHWGVIIEKIFFALEKYFARKIGDVHG